MLKPYKPPDFCTPLPDYRPRARNRAFAIYRMLPRGERLTRTEFARAFETGRHYKSSLLQLRLQRRAETTAALPGVTGVRAAFVAGKKLGKAAVRNRARRRLREIYRLSAWRQEPSLFGCDLVFLISPAALTASRDELGIALDDLLERAKRENVRTLRNVSPGTGSQESPGANRLNSEPDREGHKREGHSRQRRAVQRVWGKSGVQNDGNSRRAGAGGASGRDTGTGGAKTGESERGQAE